MYVALQKRVIVQPALTRHGDTHSETRSALARRGIRLSPYYCAGVALQAQQERDEQFWARVICGRFHCDCVRSHVLEFLKLDYYFPQLSCRPHVASAYRLASKLESLGSSVRHEDLLMILQTLPDLRVYPRELSQMTGVDRKEFELWI